MSGGLRAEHMTMCSARATKALVKFGLKAGEIGAMREATAAGRQLWVVMFEQV